MWRIQKNRLHSEPFLASDIEVVEKAAAISYRQDEPFTGSTTEQAVSYLREHGYSVEQI